VLFCGSPVSEYNVLLLNPDYNKKEVLKLILSKFEEYAKREKVGYTAFKDYKNIDKDLFKVILKYKYNKVYSMPGTFIISNSNSFEEYLLTLKKKYRLNIKNKINKSKKIENLKTELIDDYFDIINKILPLYESTYNYATGKFEKLNKNFFYNINKYLKNNSKLIITKYKDKIIGFALLLFTKNICINMRMGLDYKYAFKFHTYFLILYKNLEFIFNNKIATLYLSQSTYRPKLEIGADIQVLDAFVKHKNLIYNVLMGVSCFLLYIKYRILSKSKEPHKTLKKIFPQLFKH
jgi:predicted N-acyltransferase